MQDRKIKTGVEIVRKLEGLSVCKRAQVGCIITPDDFTKIYAMGYNGPASGFNHDTCSIAADSCACIHAEANALVKLQTTEKDLILFCSLAPCEHCAGLIINSKQITQIIYLAEFKTKNGLQMLWKSGIKTLFYACTSS